MPSYLICPNTENCSIYQKWNEKHKDEGNVINVIHHNGTEYRCIALDNLKKDEKTIRLPHEKEGEAGDRTPKEKRSIRETTCFNITLLNLLMK